MKLSRAVLVQRTKQRLLTAGTSLREIPDRVGDDGVPVMPGLTGLTGLTVMPGLTGHLRHIIGTKVRRPLSLRRACTLSSRE